MAEQDYVYLPKELKDYDTYGDDATEIDADLLGHMQDGIVKAHELIKNNMISEDGKAILDELIKKKQEEDDKAQAEANRLKFDSFTPTYYVGENAYYSGTFEKGTTVTKIKLNWSLNKTPASLTVNGEVIDVGLTEYEIPGKFKEEQSWVLTATDDAGAPVRKSASISFFLRTYFGTSTDNLSLSLRRDDILAFNQTDDDSFLSSFTVTAAADEYIYYCIPSSFGECEFSIDGWVGGFIELMEGEFINASIGRANYRLYRSNQKGLGKTTVNVFSKED